ncbi:MAG: rod shape-determining protein MreC [Salinisphaeraceae bacterium]|nr:rod shape-determining protein MreC [Salinisphaeraceae bacterium]
MDSYRDDHKPLFSRGASPTLKLLLCLAISAGLMYADHSTEYLDPARSTIATALRPIEWVASMPRHVTDIGKHLASRSDLMDENESLKQERLLLLGRMQKMAALEAENMRIRALLRSSKTLRQDMLIAEILGTSNDPYRHHVKLNKGELDGVYEGQPLIDAHGILGQIVSVNMLSSSALIITDPNHSIPVEVNRNGLRTIAQGQGQTDRLRLPYLPANADVQEGDLLVSSGLGGRYPAGYPVAVITEVHHHPGEEFLEIYAKPAALTQHGREVLLVQDIDLNTESVAQAESKPPEQATP